MSDDAAPKPYALRGRISMILGVVLAFLGVGAYATQISLQRLATPWYMPVTALLGVVLVATSLWERRTVWRGIASLVVLLLAGAEITFFYVTRLPGYAGPIAEGRPFPAFETSKANGTVFTQQDLAGDQTSVLVFFRGRW
jgi:uncharacterized membrane protein HdeD (DUF308 family)